MKRVRTFVPGPGEERAGRFVAECETSSARVREKLRPSFQDPFRWSFCELCWRQTEYVEADALRRVYKRTGHDEAAPVKFRDIYLEAQKELDQQVESYEKSLRETLGCLDPIRLQFASNISERIEAFRLKQDELVRFDAWARRGNVLSAARLPGQDRGAPKPSKLYCEMHNPRRSAEARRNYQRDHPCKEEYDLLIAEYWRRAIPAMVPTWKLEEHTHARKLAYRQLLFFKKPTLFIEELQREGCTSQAEIARKLGVSRQAVSAAIKRSQRGLPTRLPKPPPPDSQADD